MTSRFYCFARKSQKINARKYGLSKKLDSRFHRPISENFKASLSTVPWARVVNFWQSESIKSLSFWRVFEEAAAILIAIECKYMLLRAFFNSLPNFFDIETNFPRNYNKLVLCHQSFIGGNKLVKLATMYWKLSSWEMVSDRKPTGSLHIIYPGYFESFFVFTLYFVSLV